MCATLTGHGCQTSGNVAETLLQALVCRESLQELVRAHRTLGEFMGVLRGKEVEGVPGLDVEVQLRAGIPPGTGAVLIGDQRPLGPHSCWSDSPAR